METRHEYWMRRAVEEAKRNRAAGEAPIAALIVRRDELLRIGLNRKTARQVGYAHAELDAILQTSRCLGRHPDDCRIYVTLEPCAMCLGAIIFAGIRTLVFGAWDPLGGAVKLFQTHPQYRQWMPEVHAGIMEAECAALIESAAVPVATAQERTVSQHEQGTTS